MQKLIALIILTAAVAESCKVSHFRKHSMEELMYKANIVVYGNETGRFFVNDTNNPTRQDSNFEVFCVYKTDSTAIPQKIIIELVSPVSSCSGTTYKTGIPIILALQRSNNGNFRWHEVNVTPDGAAFPATSQNLAHITKICGLNNVELPVGRVNGSEPACPGPAVVSPGQCIGSGGSAGLHINLLISYVTWASIAYNVVKIPTLLPSALDMKALFAACC